MQKREKKGKRMGVNEKNSWEVTRNLNACQKAKNLLLGKKGGDHPEKCIDWKGIFQMKRGEKTCARLRLEVTSKRTTRNGVGLYME